MCSGKKIPEAEPPPPPNPPAPEPPPDIVLDPEAAGREKKRGTRAAARKGRSSLLRIPITVTGSSGTRVP